MRRLRPLVGMCFATLGVAPWMAPAAEPVPNYAPVTEIPVAGETGWDYLSIDSDARRLYVTRGTHIAVVDLDSNKVVGDIADTPGVHGFAIAHQHGRGFSSNGAEAKVSIVDLKSLATTAKVATGEGPDAILYEPRHDAVYSFNGKGRSATVINVRTGQVEATIPLDGKPEFAAVDTRADRVFVNIEDRNEVAVIDAGTHHVVHEWPIAPGEEPSGMAIDPAHHRLFVGCSNRYMLMMDTETGKVVASVPIGANVDANAFDPGLQLAFSSNGEGTVTIAREVSPSKLEVVQTLHTQDSARTMALDPKTHRIYLAAATLKDPDPPPAPGTRARRQMQPGSFKILVYGPATR